MKSHFQSDRTTVQPQFDQKIDIKWVSKNYNIEKNGTLCVNKYILRN